MWGNTKDSQLGVPGLPEIQPSPVEVKFLMEEDGLGPHNVLSVAVGASHAMCLVSRSECFSLIIIMIFFFLFSNVYKFCNRDGMSN